VSQTALTPGSIASLACSLEVAAPKPGNVHRGADFENLVMEDFLVSGTILGHFIDQYSDASVGETILAITKATKQYVGTNTNLGISLLVVPLAKSLQWHDSNSIALHQLAEVLLGLTQTDGPLVYEAIRLANPGGLGTTELADVNDVYPENMNLVEVMALAADRDLIARQYCNRFQEVFGLGIESLKEGQTRFEKLSQAIVFAHLSVMAEFPDSLIVRKCGLPEALLAQSLAQKCLQALKQDCRAGEDMDWSEVAGLDFWLRAKGHQRNPGTTADLVAASLFVAIANGWIKPPYR
jgi:triphosphoribosyl-dephospho-CoA synthase